MLMFLKKPLLEAVKASKKTQTLRKQRLNLKTGHIISFGGHARVEVLSCERILQTNLTEADAHREGFASLAELKECLESLSMSAIPELTRIRFKLL
jgi:hypothetical protein